MKGIFLYPIGTTAACRYAATELQRHGAVLVDHPTPDATHLLLDVPSFTSEGCLRGGGDLQGILRTLPPEITLIGGNLGCGYKNAMDLLKDDFYLASNAAITADCALRVAGQHLRTTFYGASVLVLGWGRIGKCLGELLKQIGAHVTIAARRERDRAMAAAMGLRVIDYPDLKKELAGCQLLFNTVPELLLHKEDTADCRHCIYIDLASRSGIEGDNVIQARGLPGIYAPEASGKLICNTILRLSKEE